MEQPCIIDLNEGDRVEIYLMVRAAEKRTASNGKSYLNMTIGDKSGEINAKNWDVNALPPDVGTIIKVRGLVQVYNGRMQFRIEKMRNSNKGDDIDISLLTPCAPRSTEEMHADIDQTIKAMKSEDLRKIVNEMLRLSGDALDYYPAAQKIHHAERSGLLHHTTDMLNSAKALQKVYTWLEWDLVFAGIIIHDLCKIDEMKSDELGIVKDYSKDGLLIGHLVRGVAKIETAAKNVEVEGELVLLLQHMVISHHGEEAYGSPRKPMFPEAEMLHWIDTLDAKMNSLKTISAGLPEGAFSEKIWSLDRRIYNPEYGQALGYDEESKY